MTAHSGNRAGRIGYHVFGPLVRYDLPNGRAITEAEYLRFHGLGFRDNPHEKIPAARYNVMSEAARYLGDKCSPITLVHLVPPAVFFPAQVLMVSAEVANIIRGTDTVTFVRAKSCYRIQEERYDKVIERLAQRDLWGSNEDRMIGDVEIEKDPPLFEVLVPRYETHVKSLGKKPQLEITYRMEPPEVTEQTVTMSLSAQAAERFPIMRGPCGIVVRDDLFEAIRPFLDSRMLRIVAASTA